MNGQNGQNGPAQAARGIDMTAFINSAMTVNAESYDASGGGEVEPKHVAAALEALANFDCGPALRQPLAGIGERNARAAVEGWKLRLANDQRYNDHERALILVLVNELLAHLNIGLLAAFIASKIGRRSQRLTAIAADHFASLTAELCDLMAGEARRQGERMLRQSLGGPVNPRNCDTEGTDETARKAARAA